MKNGLWALGSGHWSEQKNGKPKALRLCLAALAVQQLWPAAQRPVPSAVLRARDVTERPGRAQGKGIQGGCPLLAGPGGEREAPQGKGGGSTQIVSPGSSGHSGGGRTLKN